MKLQTGVGDAVMVKQGRMIYNVSKNAGVSEINTEQSRGVETHLYKGKDDGGVFPYGNGYIFWGNEKSTMLVLLYEVAIQ